MGEKSKVFGIGEGKWGGEDVGGEGEGFGENYGAEGAPALTEGAITSVGSSVYCIEGDRDTRDTSITIPVKPRNRCGLVVALGLLLLLAPSPPPVCKFIQGL